MQSGELSTLLKLLHLRDPSRLRVRRALGPELRGGASLRDVLGKHPDVARALAVEEDPPGCALREIEQSGLLVLRLGYPGYPALLAEIPDPPLALFAAGSGPDAAEPSGSPAIAIVGSRRCSVSAADTARCLARELAAAGFTIVSGLAAGVDGHAHRGALDAGGRTVAVFGHGHRYCYPARHRSLGRQIRAAGGVLVSEYPPAWTPRRSYFPERNRIVSGLSAAVLVVAASERSGSLITARLALEQGREVMAVPGTVVGGGHAGCHRLLKEGAALVESVEDVCAALGVERAVNDDDGAVSLTAAQAQLLELLGGEQRSTESLMEAMAQVPARTLSLLTELELKGFVQAVDDGYIRRPFSEARIRQCPGSAS